MSRLEQTLLVGVGWVVGMVVRLVFVVVVGATVTAVFTSISGSFSELDGREPSVLTIRGPRSSIDLSTHESNVSNRPADVSVGELGPDQADNGIIVGVVIETEERQRDGLALTGQAGQNVVRAGVAGRVAIRACLQLQRH